VALSAARAASLVLPIVTNNSPPVTCASKKQR